MIHPAPVARVLASWTCSIAMAFSVAAPANAAAGEQKAVLASFQAMLDGIAKRDKEAMLKQLLPGGSATLMRNDKPVQMSFDALTDRLSQPGTEAPLRSRCREPRPSGRPMADRLDQRQ